MYRAQTLVAKDHSMCTHTRAPAHTTTCTISIPNQQNEQGPLTKRMQNETNNIHLHCSVVRQEQSKNGWSDFFSSSEKEDKGLRI